MGRKRKSGECLAWAVANNVQALPGRFETSSAVLAGMETIALLDRSDDYYERLAGLYRAQTQSSLNAAARAAIAPEGWLWVVVGDAAKIRPQLEGLGMPIEVIEPR